MPKRKRPVEGEESQEAAAAAAAALANTERPKRRRNDTTLVDTIQFIFDALRNKKKEDDTYLCEAFLRVPRRKTEPLYYETIKSPIDMLKIQQKIKTDVYNDLNEFCNDVKLLIENAKTYYAKSTDEYKDACEMWEIFETAKGKAPDEIMKQRQQMMDDEDGKGKRRGRPPKSALALSAPMIMEEDGEPMTVKGAIEELFGAVITAEDSEGRLYSYDFRLLPPRDKYPEYYEVITNPIDLKLIAKRIQEESYEDLNAFDEDLNLMFNNACQFNEPGSRIYKDARTLKKLVHLRKEDLLHILNAKKSVKLRSKRAPNSKKWSELVAVLKEGENLPMAEEEQGVDLNTTMATHEEEESDEEVESDNPIWQLINAVRNYSTPSDPKYFLIEPFKRLPNRRWHADYYNEIKNPISLSQIRKKFLRNEYHVVSDIVEDFNLMLDNAQQYNRPDSRIHKDAVKLQKFIQTKAEELAGLEEEASESESDDDDGLGGKGRGKSNKPLTFKRRAKLLFKTLMDYMTEDGRQPIVFFIEKPTRKDYPDYYNIITDPIDMETIEAKIKGDKYSGDEDLITDFRLMFNNCRSYNEIGSNIYQDAMVLEKVLNEKIKELQQAAMTPTSGGRESPAAVSSVNRNKVVKRIKLGGLVSTASKNIRTLYTSVREFRDSGNRQLSEAFLRLPSKSLYPDYYVVIKDPIDMERILHKLKTGGYSILDDLVRDLILLFNNACKYNDPDSQIYRDALTLQKHTLQKRLELLTTEDGIPRISALVQELLMSLFISVYNHEEEDGRYTAESFTDLPEYQEIDGKRTRALSFDIMKRRLDKGLYSKLYYFQEDLFSIFDRARRLSKPNSRIYMDSITLQKAYIKIRNELCNKGATLKSRALEYNEADLMKDLEKLEASRKEERMEIEEDTNDATEDEDSKPPIQMTQDCSQTTSLSHNEIQYYVGDFVYVATDKGFESPILHIQRMWTNTSGKQMIYGCRYFRPSETFHLPTKKFYPQEVFKADKYEAHQLAEVTGKCLVLSIVDYPKFKPTGFENQDVYVSESRYSSRNRFFKKIKVWPFGTRDNLVPRPVPIEMNKVDSVFKERIERHKEELAEVEEETKITRPALPNVQRIEPNLPSTNIYYEQYNIASGAIKRGDYIYVKCSDPNKPKRQIRHITRIWTSPEGTAYFQGPVYASAEEYGSVGDRQPYKQEVFLTVAQETLPLSDIVGRCSVLHIRDYLSYRHTEIPEKDVFLCECFLDEVNARVSTLQNGLLKFQLSTRSLPDEIYIFKKPMSINKLESAPPIIVKKKSEVQQSSDFEDSMDGPPASVTSEQSGATPAPTPKTLKKMPPGKQYQQMTGRKQMTGYILFSTEIRKSITQKNPNANFGEISRLVGIEWKALTEAERKAFEDRVHQMNIENAEKALNGIQDPQPGPDIPLPNNPDVVFECSWESCDFMFEDLFDLHEHLITEPNCHVSKVTQIFECAWRGCSRHKKTSLAPFPSQVRLGRHMREVHIQKNTGRVVPHSDRSRNFFSSSRKSQLVQENSSDSQNSLYPTSNSPFSGLPGMYTSGNSPYKVTIGLPSLSGTLNGTGSMSPAQGINGNVVNGSKGYEPIFVGTPAKTQRLLHSEAYIKYIENLDKPYISNWERHIAATLDNTVINDTGRLPAHWLNGTASNDNGNVVNALWALREFMLKDSLGIAQVL